MTNNLVNTLDENGVDMSKIILKGNHQRISYNTQEDKEFVLKLINDKKLNTSQTIRYLNAMGWSNGRITNGMPNYDHGGKFRFQHVRNVLTQQMKKK